MLNKKAQACLLLTVVTGTFLPGQQETIPGAPLPGITGRELELFRLGRADFLEVEKA